MSDRRRKAPRRDSLRASESVPAVRLSLHHQVIGLVIVVCALTVATHWPVLSAQAISLDDQAFISNNRLVSNPSWASAQRFLREVLEPSTVRGYYLPLSMISLMLDYAMGGRPDDLQVFHRTSLVLHAINTGLITVLLYSLFGRAIPAALAGLLFGVHPLTVEPIAWVGERKTLLAAFFALACLFAYVRNTRHPGWKSWAASLILYILALMSKPTAAPLPVLLVLLDYWPLRRLTMKALLEKVPFFSVLGLFAVITVASHSRTAGILPSGESHILSLPLMIPYLLVFYGGKIIWPTNLTSVYSLPEPLAMSNPPLLLSAIAACALVVVLVFLIRWSRAPLAGSLFFFVAILPTLGLLQYSWVTASDKYVYLPALGLLMVLAWGMGRLWDLSGRNVLMLRSGLVGLVLLLAVAELRGVRRYLVHWRDTLTHARYMVELAPKAAGAQNHLGHALASAGEVDAAVACFQEALRLQPAYPEAEHNLGLALQLQGRREEAFEHLRKAVGADQSNPYAWYHLGSAFQERGRSDEAIGCFRKALDLNRDDALLHYSLGQALQLQGQAEEAIEQFQRTVEIRPDHAGAHIALGSLLAVHGQLDDAVAHFRRALAAAPNDAQVHYNLGLALQLKNQAGNALEHYQEALRINPDYAEAHNALGGLLMRAGRPAEALDHFREAVRLNPDWLPPLNAAAWILATYPDESFRSPEEAVSLAERAAGVSKFQDAGVLDTLAAAYASAGQFDKAAATAENGQAIALRSRASALAAEMAQRLELYRQGRPYREPAPSSAP